MAYTEHTQSPKQACIVSWTIILTAILIPQVFQPALSALWNTLYHSSLYRLSTFETILTVTSYAVLEPWYTYKFAYHPELRIDVRDGSHRAHADGGDDVVKADKREQRRAGPKLPKMKRPSKRLWEIFVYVAPLLSMDLVMIKKFAGVPLNDIRMSGGYAPLPVYDYQQFGASTTAGIYATANTSQSPTIGDEGSIHSSFLLPTLHNITLSSPLQLTRALPPLPPTSRRLALELLTSLILYDLLFFLLHLVLHTVPILSRTHLRHHTHQEIHPQVTNALSIAERLSLVLLANFSLNIIGSHVLTRTLFVPIFVDLLIEVHCGMDLPFGYEKFLPRGWGLGSREHAVHHRTGKGHYAPFFAWCDWGLRRMVEGRQRARSSKEE